MRSRCWSFPTSLAAPRVRLRFSRHDPRRIAAGASGRRSSHKAHGASTGWGGARLGEEIGDRPPNLAACEAAHHHSDVAGARLQDAGVREDPAERLRRAAAARSCRARRRRSAPGRRWFPDRRSRRGSATRRVAVRFRICQPTSRSLAAPAGIGTPSASQSSSATNRRAAGPSGSSRASFWNLSEACIGLTSANSVWKHRHRHLAEGLAEGVEQLLGAGRSARAEHGAQSAGDAVGRGEVPGRADGDERRDVVGSPRRETDGQRPAHAVAKHRHRPVGEPAGLGERGQQPPRSVGVEVEPGLLRTRHAPVEQQGPQALPGQPAQQRASGQEVEHVGAVDQARHHQQRRPVRIGGLGRPAVVEQARAAVLPDRRADRRGVRRYGWACQISRPRTVACSRAAISPAISTWSRSPPSCRGARRRARRPRGSSGCRRAARPAAPGRRRSGRRRGGRSAGSAPRPDGRATCVSAGRGLPGPDRRRPPPSATRCRSQRSR